jgi:hypothetical protein
MVSARIAARQSEGDIMKRWRRRGAICSRSAVSPVISTIILSTTLLTVMIITTGVATDILRNQMASNEFDSAKSLIKSISSEIDALIYKSEATSVIKTSFFYTAPGYTETGKIMNVSFTGHGETFHVEENTFNIESIQGVGGSIDYTLQGSDLTAVPSYLGSFGRIYISKPYNWRVALDYNRAQYTYAGVANLFNGATTTPYNIVEITVLELSFTQFDTSDSSIIILRNDGVDTSTFTLTGDWDMTVTTPDEGSYVKSLTDMGGNPSYPTQVQFNKVNLNVHVMGGS